MRWLNMYRQEILLARDWKWQRYRVGPLSAESVQVGLAEISDLIISGEIKSITPETDTASQELFLSFSF